MFFQLRVDTIPKKYFEGGEGTIEIPNLDDLKDKAKELTKCQEDNKRLREELDIMRDALRAFQLAFKKLEPEVSKD